MSDHLFRSVERAGRAPQPDVFIRLGETSIDDPPLGRRILIVRVGELRSVDHQLGCDDDLAAGKGEFDQVAFGEAGLAPHACGDSHLTFVLDSSSGVHKGLNFRNPEFRTPDGRISDLLTCPIYRCCAVPAASPEELAAILAG